MTKRAGRRLAALTLALLLATVTVTTAIPSASAHPQWKDETRSRRECSWQTVMVEVVTYKSHPHWDDSMSHIDRAWKPERQRVCKWVRYQARVKKWHVHLPSARTVVCTAAAVTTGITVSIVAAKKTKHYGFSRSAGVGAGEAVRRACT